MCDLLFVHKLAPKRFRPFKDIDDLTTCVAIVHFQYPGTGNHETTAARINPHSIAINNLFSSSTSNGGDGLVGTLVDSKMLRCCRDFPAYGQLAAV